MTTTTPDAVNLVESGEPCEADSGISVFSLSYRGLSDFASQGSHGSQHHKLAPLAPDSRGRINTKGNPMNKATLEAIKARAMVATPGPWEAPQGGIELAVTGLPSWRAPIVCQARGVGVSRDVVYLPFERDDDCGNSYADAAFIAHARVDVPRLVAEVERLQAELAAERGRACCGGTHGHRGYR